jgi:PilZ domain-containing protein
MAARNPRRRSLPRYTLRSLAYVKLDHANGGIIRDISERGVALQAVTPLSSGAVLMLRFDLLSPRVRIEVPGHVAWSDETGQAGVCFSGLPPRQVRALREWILIQIFSAAAVSGRDSIFAPMEDQMVLSAACRPAITVEPPLLPEAVGDIRWWLFSFTAHTLSVLIDALVLVCAVLLFSVSSLAVMGGVPPWPLAVTLLFVVSTIFIAAYQLLFSEQLCGPTPGKRLARAAAADSRQDTYTQRFR